MQDRIQKTNPGPKPGLLIWAGGFAPIGGIETFIADLGQALVEAGVEVEVLAWDRRSKLLNNMRKAGIHISCSPWRWGCRWAWPDWLLLPSGIWKCRKARVVFFGKTFGPAMHNLIHRFGRRPGSGQRFIYITPYRPAELWAGITRVAEKTKVEVMLKTFDLIICQNSMFADDLRSLGYHGPIEMLPNLPPPAAENPAPYPEGTLTLGFLGRLEHQKNLPALLNIFALLLRERADRSDQGPSLRLRLIGEGSQRTTLMTLARELGIADSVDFSGAIARERVRQAIQSCHLFCFTSHPEGQPLASLEILAEGRPIIATAVGAFPDMLAHSALGAVVPSGDTDAFLSALNHTLACQKKGLLSPQDTVQAYRKKFDRNEVLRKFIEVVSPNASSLETGPRESDKQ
jgi:glycosyltransferase involved in cell wall biosynthesis